MVVIASCAPSSRVASVITRILRRVIPKRYFQPHVSRAIHSAHERTAIKSQRDEDALRCDIRKHRWHGVAAAGVRRWAKLQTARHQLAGELPERARRAIHTHARRTSVVGTLQ